MSENRTDLQGTRLKWAGIILCFLLVLAMTCAGSFLWGGMVGFAIGRASTVHRYIRPHTFERSPVEPFPSIPRQPFHTDSAWLGVHYQMQERGALVTGVFDGSPAEEGGLQTGDIIVRVDGRYVDATLSLGDVIQAYRPGDRIAMTILREGREQVMRVQLGVRMQNPVPLVPDSGG